MQRYQKQGRKLQNIHQKQKLHGEQLRQTIVSLYFKDKDNSKLVPEARNIDVKQLTKEPYQTLINLLIAGPKNEKLESTIPEGTILNKTELKENILWVDLSKEFIENCKQEAEAESMAIYCIVNTMTQLNEIVGVKIVIDGNEEASFLDNTISLKDVFMPKEEIT